MFVRSAVLALVLAAACFSLAAAQQTLPIEPRPDLGLTLQDLPPGFGILPAVPDATGPIAAASRGYARADAAEGPSLVATVTLGTYDPHVASLLVPALARVFVSSPAVPGMQESGGSEWVEWEPVDAVGLGDQAIMYHFRVEAAERDPRADGGLAVFRRHELVGAVLVINEHGQGLASVREYASLIDDRMKRALGP
ncbi:MAG TPA: hypothetical protein VII06_18365 [Chloroflexota bacterium]|jgi:hypothetical protein